MSKYRLQCGACPQEFDVGATESEFRCPSCGAKHRVGGESFDSVELVSNPAQYPETNPKVLMRPAWD